MAEKEYVPVGDNGRDKQRDGENAGEGSVWLYIFQNIRNLTVENKTQRIEGLGGDRLPFFHPVQGVGGYAMFKNQFIFGNAFLK